MSTTSPREGTPSIPVDAVLRRVTKRIVWLLFLGIIINFVDRTNIGFAALTMNADLGLSAATFGLIGTAFSITYALFEIPSNLLLARVGARKWLARIMITWGIASSCTAFATGPRSLAVIRALVGAAEAGFVPGLVLYVASWYPQFHRARVQTLFLVGQPIALILGAPIASAVLSMKGIAGWAGWRWLFFFEGLPAIALGVAFYFALPDDPRTAHFLSENERGTLLDALSQDRHPRFSSQSPDSFKTVARALASRRMVAILCAYACVSATNGALALWSPQIIRSVMPQAPLWKVSLLAAIPPACTAAWMIHWARASDLRRERFWHAVAPMGVTVVAWGLAAGGSSPWLVIAGLTLASMCALST
jgi:ACS family 4-hydroxyphenylacetate permease-like MFS transporter